MEVQLLVGCLQKYCRAAILSFAIITPAPITAWADGVSDFNAAIDALRAGDDAQAIELFSSIIESSDRYERWILAGAHTGRGQAIVSSAQATGWMVTRDQVGSALADYDAALAIDSTHAWSWRQRGRAFRFLGEYDAAIDDLTTALGLELDQNSYYFRFEAFEGVRNYTCAKADLISFIDFGPLPPWMTETRARERLENLEMLERRQLGDEAENAVCVPEPLPELVAAVETGECVSSHSRAPFDDGFASNIAVAYQALDRGDYSNAVGGFNGALNTLDTMDELAEMAGPNAMIFLFDAGSGDSLDPDEAREVADGYRVLSLNGLAQAQNCKGNFADAANAADASLDLEPNNPVATDSLIFACGRIVAERPAACARVPEGGTGQVASAAQPRNSTRDRVTQSEPNAVQVGFASFFNSAIRTDDWRSIHRDESILVAQQYADARLPGLRRMQQFNEDTDAVAEYWMWNTGGLKVSRIGRNQYLRDGSDRNSSAGLLDQLATWPNLAAVELAIARDDIESKANYFGVYFYVISDRNSADLVCFFFRQGLPPLTDILHEESRSNQTRGEISGYDCRSRTSATSVAAIDGQLSNQFVPFLEVLRAQLDSANGHHR